MSITVDEVCDADWLFLESFTNIPSGQSKLIAIFVQSCLWGKKYETFWGQFMDLVARSLRRNVHYHILDTGP